MRRALLLLRRRAISSIPVLLIVIVGTFFLLESAPGDAVDAYLLSIGGGDAALVASLRQSYGLDQSALARLWLYFTSLAKFDLGWSVTFGRPILDLILERLPNTLWLMGSALALSFSLGSILGIVAGARPGSAADKALSVGSLALYAVPSFWLGLVLSVVFSVQLRWFPTAGIESIASGKVGLERALDIARHLVLPVSALGFIYLALFLRMMRSGMAEAWRQDYALAARAKGLSRPRIVLRHIARNALAAAGHDARPASRVDARRQRRHRKRVCNSGLRTAGPGGRCRPRRAPAYRHHRGQRGAGHTGQSSGRYHLCAA